MQAAIAYTAAGRIKFIQNDSKPYSALPVPSSRLTENMARRTDSGRARRSGPLSLGGRHSPDSGFIHSRRIDTNFGAPRYPPILTPMISPEMTSSTRRFFCRPAAVLLSATGTVLPKPLATMPELSSPCCAM
jgi:hypothetical protein